MFWQQLEPAKQEIVASVRAQLAADSADAPPTLLALIDLFAESHLLRRSTFLQIANRGGAFTSKGKARALLRCTECFRPRASHH